jgi:hypothetical protein
MGGLQFRVTGRVRTRRNAGTFDPAIPFDEVVSAGLACTKLLIGQRRTRTHKRRRRRRKSIASELRAEESIKILLVMLPSQLTTALPRVHAPTLPRRRTAASSRVLWLRTERAILTKECESPRSPGCAPRPRSPVCSPLRSRDDIGCHSGRGESWFAGWRGLGSPRRIPVADSK